MEASKDSVNDVVGWMIQCPAKDGMGRKCRLGLDHNSYGTSHAGYKPIRGVKVKDWRIWEQDVDLSRIVNRLVRVAPPVQRKRGLTILRPVGTILDRLMVERERRLGGRVSVGGVLRSGRSSQRAGGRSVP